LLFFHTFVAFTFIFYATSLYQTTKWRSYFVVLKPLLGLGFNPRKCGYTFVDLYSKKKELANRVAALRAATRFLGFMS
jgi:drug/metabolite transporter (DMT)-like permease